MFFVDIYDVKLFMGIINMYHSIIDLFTVIFLVQNML